jgi:ADP-ribose pyrophosphatase YjhB (NUDIX family)
MTEASLYRIATSVVVRDPYGRILLVREADPRVQGKLNLPGGHLNRGETLTACARREVREETGLSVNLLGLVGVCVLPVGVHFVFLADPAITDATPGDDILSCEWFSPQELLALPDDRVLRPRKLHAIMRDLSTRSAMPVDLIHNIGPELNGETRA